ncbi:short chain dehydrogenase atnD [Apiospora phragmitis]|uniref:Short chain dehydrogenase atnD n=1 Tax=Apiospora phragmitis TaxID=2905665 RepID=A0ABR1UHH3_9PEZI
MGLFELSPLQFFVSQWTSLPYPATDCTDKVVIVTGGNVGLGLEAARHFVRLNAAKVIIACRNPDKGAAAKADIEASAPPSRKGVVEVWPLDLSSFASVKDFCRRADQQLVRLDILLENASVLHTQFFEREGYEEQVTVNVLSTFLLALLLLPLLRRTAARFNAAPHLTVVSSDAHVVTNFRCRDSPAVLQALRGDQDLMSRYGDTKLLQLLIVRELAKALDGGDDSASSTGMKQQPRVILNTLNPGLCRSELFRHALGHSLWILYVSMRLFARTAEMGSRNLVAAATALEDTHGKYLSDCKVWEPSRFVRSQDGANVQRRVFAELLEELEKIEPGVTANI